VCLINVFMVENNFLSVSDQTLNVLDAVESIESNACTSDCWANELPINEKQRK